MTKPITPAIRNGAGQNSRRGVIRAVTALAVIAGFFGGAVVSDGFDLSVSDNIALAKGGNGGGNGGGGGHGGGNKGGRGEASGRDSGIGNAMGHGHDQINGRARRDAHEHGWRYGERHSDPPGAPSLEKKSASEDGISASALGSLNAAHASSTARDNASPNSMVGRIAAFAEAVESDEINAAAEALAAKANKPINEAVVTEVARQAQIELSEEAASAIAARAAEIQAGESEEPTGESMPGGS